MNNIVRISDGVGNSIYNAGLLTDIINNFEEIISKILNGDASVEEKIEELHELNDDMYNLQYYCYSDTSIHDVTSVANNYRKKIVNMIDELYNSSVIFEE